MEDEAFYFSPLLFTPQSGPVLMFLQLPPLSPQTANGKCTLLRLTLYSTVVVGTSVAGKKKPCQ